MNDADSEAPSPKRLKRDLSPFSSFLIPSPVKPPSSSIEPAASAETPPAVTQNASANSYLDTLFASSSSKEAPQQQSPAEPALTKTPNPTDSDLDASMSLKSTTTRKATVTTSVSATRAVEKTLSASALKKPARVRSSGAAPTFATAATASVASQPDDSMAYSIVVGGRKFKLSWGSLTNDSPNYFTTTLSQSHSKSLYIDRDPNVFELIVQHLRGYFIMAKDEYHCENLMADAHFYGLKRLKQLLRDTSFLNVGGRVFHLPTELLEKDGPNYFTGPLFHFESHPDFIGREHPPKCIPRDPDLFADIVRHLKGYTINIRDETHRSNLLKDSRFYALRQLRDKLLASRKTVNGFGEALNTRPEVLLWLNDLRVNSLARPTPASAVSVATAAPATTTNSAEAEVANSSAEVEVANNSAECTPLLYTNHTQIMYKKEGNLHALLVQTLNVQLRCHYPPPSSTCLPCTRTTYTLEASDTELYKLKDIANAVKAQGVDLQIHIGADCAIFIDDVAVSAEELAAVGGMAAARLEGDGGVAAAPVDYNTAHAEELAKLTQLVKPDYVVGEGTCLKLCIDRCILAVHLIEEKIKFSLIRFNAISSKLQLNLKREFLPLP